jgi:hypothetical protein
MPSIQTWFIQPKPERWTKKKVVVLNIHGPVMSSKIKHDIEKQK